MNVEFFFQQFFANLSLTLSKFDYQSALTTFATNFTISEKSLQNIPENSIRHSSANNSIMDIIANQFFSEFFDTQSHPKAVKRSQYYSIYKAY